MRAAIIQCYIICFFLLSGISYGQHTEFIASNFPGKTESFNIAFKQYKAGLKLFQKSLSKGTHFESVDLLLQPAYAFNPKHAYLNFMLGVCRYETNKHEEAFQFFQQADQLSSQHDTLFNYYLGLTEHALRMYDSAIVHLQEFLVLHSGHRTHDSTASKRLEESKYGMILVENVVHTKMEELKEFNTEYNEFLPILGHDGSYIVFNREQPHPSQKGKFVQTIWISHSNESGWSSPEPLPLFTVDTKEFNALSISHNGTKMLLRAKHRHGGFDIYESHLGPKGWEPPTLLSSMINTVHDEPFATYAENDKVIYFISNKRGGFGGYDIWKAERIDQFLWSKPVNMGPLINSAYNEMYVSIPADSTILYFTSDGHATVGYTDIFRSRFDNGAWTRPNNLGYPVNCSLSDDQFMIMPSGLQGLHVRFNGNNTDLFLTHLPPKSKKPALIFEERLLSGFPYVIPHNIIPKDD